ncbi:hypothetical protein ABEB36_004419 [Hypothenemus hampei]|uniref:HTH psq-type domain-containing protein n=1 Tax=Hypothenemus hampei TaxID=57062 RepID=A0ABD1F3C0_HYPHA
MFSVIINFGLRQAWLNRYILTPPITSYKVIHSLRDILYICAPFFVPVSVGESVQIVRKGIGPSENRTMPRNYIRKTNKNSWTQENMRNAINAILKENKSIRKVGREYGIPESTIRKRINQKQTQPGNLGRNAVFSQEQEAELVEYIINMSQTYFGITQMQLRKIAFDFAELKK